MLQSRIVGGAGLCFTRSPRSEQLDGAIGRVVGVQARGLGIVDPRCR